MRKEISKMEFIVIGTKKQLSQRPKAKKIEIDYPLLDDWKIYETYECDYDDCNYECRIVSWPDMS